MPDPLILPLVALTAGILLARWLGFSTAQAAWPMLAFAGLSALAWFRRSRGLARITVALAWTACGMWAVAIHNKGSKPEIDAGPKETLILEGCVVDPPVFSKDRAQFTLELSPHARARVTIPLDEGEIPPPLDYGQHIEIDARIRPPHNYNNPGAFDYAAYLAHQDIYWTAVMPRRTEPRILKGRCGYRALNFVYALRTRALRRLDQLYGSDTYSSSMMKAILIGDSSSLEKVWTEDFRRTGTFHALVISGVHVTVLAGVLLFLLRLCALPQIPALAITAVAAWVYALVSGMSAPVVRAAGGFTLFLIARFFFRRTRVLNLLAVIAIAYLLWDPDQLWDASFQLSFLSVAAIGALATPLLEARDCSARARPGSDQRLGNRPSSGASRRPSPGRTAACGRDHFSLGANSQGVVRDRPGLELETIAIRPGNGDSFRRDSGGAGAADGGIVSPGFLHRLDRKSPDCAAAQSGGALWDFLRFSPAGIGSRRWRDGCWRWRRKSPAWHAHLEPAWRIPDPPLWLGVAFVGSLVAMAILVRRRIARWPALAAVLALFALLLWQPWPRAAAIGVLELTAIDVAQGDSLLLSFPQGKLMVVDGGGILQYGRARKSNFDTGEDVVSPYLWSRGIRRIDILVATHAHEDHIGGLKSIMENFRPSEFWVGANPPQALMAQARELHIRVFEQQLSPPFDFSGARIQFLSPPDGYTAPKIGNNDSLAFRVTLWVTILSSHRRSGAPHGGDSPERGSRPPCRRFEGRPPWLEDLHHGAVSGGGRARRLRSSPRDTKIPLATPIPTSSAGFRISMLRSCAQTMTVL